MTGRDLKANRIKLVGDGYGMVKKMADKLETPKRTYQGYEARSGSVPGAVAVAVTCLLQLAEIAKQEQ